MMHSNSTILISKNNTFVFHFFQPLVSAVSLFHHRWCRNKLWCNWESCIYICVSNNTVNIRMKCHHFIPLIHCAPRNLHFTKPGTFLKIRFFFFAFKQWAFGYNFLNQKIEMHETIKTIRVTDAWKINRNTELSFATMTLLLDWDECKLSWAE